VTAHPPSPSLRVLVAGLVDYAGLFPPAGRSMHEAVEEYAAHLESPDAWMLGRFVVPTARLDELAAVAASRVAPGRRPWRVSALVGDQPDADAAAIHAFTLEHGGVLQVDAVEAKADSVERIEAVCRALHAGLDTYVELPLEPDPRRLLEAVRSAGLSAKIRTGGVTPDAFPAPALVARFLLRCAELEVPFKATAGLHHPLRSEQRLTYEPDAPRSTMFGFLNVFLAAALAARGVTESELVALLEERHRHALAFTDAGAQWRDHVLSLDELMRSRRTFAISFGSCSFREPVDDLRELALL
jgi:hypothetical protein